MGARGSATFVLAMVCVCPAWCQHGEAPNVRHSLELTSVESVRKLPLEKAARSIPVRLEGVVTALSGYKNSFFVQDGTAGISVDRRDDAVVRAGDRVKITGVSNPGMFAPVIMASKVVVLGLGVQPLARPVTYVDLIGGDEDSQRVELTGVVHSSRIGELFEKQALFLTLDVGAATVNLIVREYGGLDFARLIDAKIRVRGVCSTSFNKKRQFIGAGLFISSPQDIFIEQPASGDPFSGQTLPISSALRFGQAQHRVKVEGVVTWQVPGKVLYIQNAGDGLRAETSSPDLVPAGTKVEVVGFPAMGEYSPVLTHGVFRAIGGTEEIAPLPIEAKDVIARTEDFDRVSFDAQLVQIDGRVIQSRTEGARRILMLRAGDEVFEARQEDVPSGRPTEGVKEGSIVRLTGICSIITDADRKPTSFYIVLRSERDMVLLKSAPWWNPVHALTLFLTLGAATMMIALWVIVLRSRVDHQTRIIRESEARYRHLAEHDVLTGLLNRSTLEQRLGAALADSQRQRLNTAVFTVDIDHFKRINDKYGHLVGDEVLQAVAGRLRSAVRGTDTVARTGGEEFTIVAASLALRDGANPIGATILQAFREPVKLSDQEIAVTVSIGCALFPGDGTKSDDLRKRSDQALYEAKRTGRNRIVFASRAAGLGSGTASVPDHRHLPIFPIVEALDF